MAHGPDPGGGLSSYSPHAKKTVAEGRVALAFAACALAVPWRELSLRASIRETRPPPAVTWSRWLCQAAVQGSRPGVRSKHLFASFAFP